MSRTAEDWHMAKANLRKKQMQEEVDPSGMKNDTKYWDKATHPFRDKGFPGIN